MLNSNMMLSGDGHISFGFGKPAGWYINQTAIDTFLGKCGYAWDGGTMGKFNMGCGCHTSATGCDDKGSPYYNIDPDTGKPNTGKSRLVASCACENKRQSTWPTTWQYGPDCFWKGAAYYPPDGLIEDDLWNMLKWRSDHQTGGAGDRTNLGFWNEVVLDGEQFLKALDVDAAAVVLAMVYNTADPNGKSFAKRMSRDMANEYKLDNPVPIIGLNVGVDVSDGDYPFVVEEDTLELTI